MHAYKTMVKCVIGLIGNEKLYMFKETINWLRYDNSYHKLPKVARITSKKLSEEPELYIFERKEVANYSMPYCYGELRIADQIFVFIIPFCDRDKKKFRKLDEVVAAAGIKVAAPHLDDVVSGSPLRVLSEDTDVEQEILNEIDNITIDTEDEGILVKADTIGSLEAVVKLLREMDIPIRAADIGDVNRRDIINSSIAYDENELHGAIIAFNVDVHPNSEEDLNNSEVKLFSGDVIYQILEEYEEWVKQKQEDKKKSFYDAIIKPAKFVSLPKLVFRQSKPAIIGIESLSGTLKQGQQLINKDGHVVGSIASMEDKGETLPDISRGQRVAMAIKDAIVGKDFEEGDELYVDIPEKHYKYIEREFKDKLTEDEFETLYEFLEIKRKQDPDWGSFGLFE